MTGLVVESIVELILMLSLDLGVQVVSVSGRPATAGATWGCGPRVLGVVVVAVLLHALHALGPRKSQSRVARRGGLVVS